MYVYVYLYTEIYTYIHTYMHACMHACMYVYIYIYMCVCVFTVSASGFEGRGKDFGLKNRLKLFSLELGPVKLTARCDASP